MSAEIAGDLAVGVIAGLALGAGHLFWLWRASARIGAGGGRAGALLAGAVLRLAVILSGFIAITWMAAYPGLRLAGALGGFALARMLGLWRMRHGKR